jgi:hypothetical protein
MTRQDVFSEIVSAKTVKHADFRRDTIYTVHSKEEGGDLLRVVFLCPCGCGRTVRLPIGPDGWQLTLHEGLPTLRPSVWDAEGAQCGSHFHITNGRVSWC